jgi:flagellar motor switch protein FliM
MDESKILSEEEVDAILKVTQDKSGDLTSIIRNENLQVDESVVNTKAIKTIMELTWSECENLLSSFLRKKIAVRLKDMPHRKLADYLDSDKHMYSVFLIEPFNCYSLVIIDMPFLHYMISYLYGGQKNTNNDTIIESPGKIGVIITTKISEIILDGFIQACKEYGSITYQTIKTVTLPNLISKLGMEDRVFSLNLSAIFGEKETSFSIILAEEFIFKFLPANPVPEVPATETQSWRTAIQKQVIDSYVTLSVSIPEVTIKASELLALKPGDLIPISDPTSVNICLNSLKLFSGTAGQANSTRVVKILDEY